MTLTLDIQPDAARATAAMLAALHSAPLLATPEDDEEGDDEDDEEGDDEEEDEDDEDAEDDKDD